MGYVTLRNKTVEIPSIRMSQVPYKCKPTIHWITDWITGASHFSFVDSMLAY